ncbi:MAG: hypothetical protein M1832_005114 [Thelocarpon impressellum]|nr:MAG: hypothetical protein M1832_005114 [Thelocarpon impressellum]
MFSEYASRFLAQSQSRISFLQPNADKSQEPSRGHGDRPRGRATGPSRFATSRSYLQRPAIGKTYQPQPSRLSQFPFASRTSAAAPLFYSATDEFREEDDEVEREREVADFYALQRSRRHFGASQLQDSSEADDASRGSDGDGDADGRDSEERGLLRGGGIKSSWRGGKASARARDRTVATVDERDGSGDDERSVGGDGGKGKGRMVDIGLESAIQSEAPPERDEAHPPDDLAIEMPPDDDDDPPPFQQFRRAPAGKLANDGFLPYETDADADAAAAETTARPRPPSSDASSVPPTLTYTPLEPPRHDPFWASLFLICLAALFASFFLVYLHTEPPTRKRPLGDTIYTTLHSSFHLLAIDTVLAVMVSLLWLALLRSFVRPLVYLILLAVPVILVSFSIYPLLSSFGGRHDGASLQDRAMRWLSLVPAVGAVLWTYTVYKGRHALDKATGILEFASRILAANPALLALGFATLGGVVAWTWLWLGMFARVFLGGHLSSSKTFFVIDAGSWWLGACFVLMYMWTLAVGGGVQRATTAATVSQWYFHRLAMPAPTSRQVVLAALSHATTTQFGTICLSTLLALLVRLPLLLLPRRLLGAASLFAYSLVPTSVAALTNPLTLTHAAIHSQPLAASARSLSRMTFLSPSSPVTTLHPRAFSSRPSSSAPLLPYRLARLLLHATRLMMALALGFGGWVSTARMLAVAGAVGGLRGSLYAYVVGLAAAFIGWGVLGAMEGVLAGVVDAAVVCWASEAGKGGYCLEANHLFGEQSR